MIGSLCTLTYHSVDTTFSHWLDAAGGLRRAQRVRTNTRADVGFCITLLLAGYSVGILPVLQTQCNFIDFLSGGVTMRAFEARNPSASSFRQLNGCLRVSFVSKASLKLWCPSNLLWSWVYSTTFNDMENEPSTVYVLCSWCFLIMRFSWWVYHLYPIPFQLQTHLRNSSMLRLPSKRLSSLSPPLASLPKAYSRRESSANYVAFLVVAF